MKIQFKRVSVLRGLIETYLLGVLFLHGLLIVSDQLPVNAITLGLMYIGAGSGFWYALRLKMPSGPLWKVSPVELVNSFIIGFTTAVLLPFSAIPFDLWGKALANKPVGFEVLPLLTSIPVFIGTRLICFGWFAWNRLRKKRIIWGLVHTQMSVVVFLALIFSLIGAIGITIQANQQYLESSIAATLAHRLVLTFLPFSAVAMLVTVTTLSVVLPPAALVSYLFSRRITQRVENLALTTNALRNGDYSARVKISGDDEISSLQTDFNTMAEDLETAMSSLQSERDKVTSLLESKRQLTANISHELRTPLATINSYLEPIIREPQLANPDRLLIIERELQRLEHLINDLFSLSRAESGVLDLEIVPLDVGQLVQGLVDTYAGLAWQSDKVEIVARLECEKPTALVDGVRLEQILTNLIRNGIRHTLPGGIIGVVVGQEQDWVRIEVQDTGSGIPPEDLPRIWDRFFRGDDDTRHAAQSGAGLGLALVKELTEAMGGTVAVESTMGKGSKFSVRLPSAYS